MSKPELLSEDLLRKFDTPGPRYTSYPTADRFVQDFELDEVMAVFDELAHRDPGKEGPLSVYVHIPFCEQLCYYCACNKIITKHHDRAGEYLDALERELTLVVERIGQGRPVSQLHFGGGSPTFLSDGELTRVVTRLKSAFALVDDIEMSIEVDPRTVTPQRLAHFRTLGFNRLSFGVQDFDADVQKAVHRVQSYESVALLMKSARELGYVSINADLIYGLPKQTPESFQRTIKQIGQLRPDRIALYAYAHLPARFKPQRRILNEDLPPAGDRVSMLGSAIAGFFERGYTYIGMDHFALPEDSLAIAKHEGRLHRNFQGYSTQSDRDLIALGLSSIGRIGGVFYQNAKALPEYYESLGSGLLPVVRGYSSTTDDTIRRDVIMALMCQGLVDFTSIEQRHGIAFHSYFQGELETLTTMGESGLFKLTERTLAVTERGWYLVRALAMVFDSHLQRDRHRSDRYSRVV